MTVTGHDGDTDVVLTIALTCLMTAQIVRWRVVEINLIQS
jgi:hypothetical protein